MLAARPHHLKLDCIVRSGDKSEVCNVKQHDEHDRYGLYGAGVGAQETFEHDFCEKLK
jgi:hypothetical protein